MHDKLFVPFEKLTGMKGIWGVLLFFCLGKVSSQTIESKTNPNAPLYEDISGTPYVLPDWSDGVIRFSSGRVATQFKIKFDCIRNQLLLQFNGSTFATENKIKEFVIYVKSNIGKDSMIFRRGFPVIDRANEETFYEVAVEGKTKLLMLHSKHIIEEEQFVSKVIYRKLRDENFYFLLKDGLMIELPADRALITEKFTGYTDKLAQFINEKQLKFREKEDFKMLVTFYNSLL